MARLHGYARQKYAASTAFNYPMFLHGRTGIIASADKSFAPPNGMLGPRHGLAAVWLNH
ncbi:MAG: hypothetical protein ACP5O7_05805 [Phycisphaerae bacterium]